MYLILILTLLCLFISWLYFKWVLMKNYWTNRGVTQTPLHPIYGSMSFLQRKNPNFWFADLYNHYKLPYVGIWVFWRRGLVVNCPDLTRKILVKDFDVFRNRNISSGKTDPIGAQNLFTVNDPMWTLIRKRLSTTFTASKLRVWQELYQSKVKDLVDRIKSDNEKGISIDLKSLFADYTTDIIGESSFGILCQATKNSAGPLRAMTKKFEKFGIWRGLAWSSIFFLPEVVDIFRFSLWPKDTVEYFKKIFIRMVEERGGFEREVDGKRDLLDTLLKLKQDALRQNQDMNVDILVSNAIVFLQGGYDTSSTVLTYAIYELAHNPDHQQKLYEELVKAKRSVGQNELDASILGQLPYLNAVIKEVLRKFPVLGWLDRVALQDYQIDEHLTIPAGTVVYINVIGMQRDPEYYPDPLVFRPERFLPENADNIPPYTYLPFGVGPRVCIGTRIGQNTMQYALASVILNFEVCALPGSLKPNDVPIQRKGLLYTPEDPLSVEFKPRL